MPTVIYSNKFFLVGIEPTGKRNPKPLGSFDDPETRNPKITCFLVGIEPTGKRNPKPLGSFDDPETRNPKITWNGNIKGIKMIRPAVWAYRPLSGLAARNYRTLTEDFHSDKADIKTMRNPQKG
ncbi:hypothetical protein Glove_198g101 [Diversispora epigaea]|uniref:Uncharacterized protein n=1 Tax=Diversispora epigaea TaxID=1348612 RepID=A0A397IKC1_9GLOM|nr:hypothetical protein Glove_198g101 [Diversispora epigaea]